MDESATVPGRSCGDCTVCCTVLQIEQPGFSKRAGDTCVHCVAGGGCGIYATRFEVCREWFCGWRLFAWTGDAARPDRCGFLAYHDEAGAAATGDLGRALNFMVLRLDTLTSPALEDALLAAMAEGFRTSLVVPGEPGEVPLVQCIDDLLHATAPEKRRAQLRRDLGKLHRAFRFMSMAGFMMLETCRDGSVIAHAR